VEAVIAVLGAGGHGHDIARTLRDFQFFDDNPDLGYPPISEMLLWSQWLIGVNDGGTRKQIAERLAQRGITADERSSNWIHPAGHVETWSVKMGCHTHINGGAFVTRATLGDYVTVGPNATICGDVTIGDLVSIGAGAVICEFCKVGDGATIGAGAVVKPRTIVPAGETWVGVPAGLVSVSLVGDLVDVSPEAREIAQKYVRYVTGDET
jgi:carbonic anhydrase/acetyltransferase-like protein (isoleucine patch superfamily)